MEPPGDVAGCDDPVGGVQRLRTEHPVVEREAGVAKPVELGLDADPHHHEVGREVAAVRESYDQRRGPVDAGRDLGDTHARPDLDTLSAMELRAGRAHLRTEHPRHRGLERLGHGDRRAKPVTGRGHFEPDEPCADHHHSAALSCCSEALTDGQAVVERAQGENPGHPLGSW